MKSLLFIFMVVVLGMTVVGDKKNGTALLDIYNNRKETVQENTSFESILGNWVGTGFVTTENGIQQYIEIEESNLRTSSTEYQMVCVGKYPVNGFIHAYNKKLFYNSVMNSWYIKGTVNDQILHDSRTFLNDTTVLSYTFYDINSVLTRYTIVRKTDDSFTEIEEKWGTNGWAKTAWFRMIKKYGSEPYR